MSPWLTPNAVVHTSYSLFSLHTMSRVLSLYSKENDRLWGGGGGGEGGGEEGKKEGEEGKEEGEEGEEEGEEGKEEKRITSIYNYGLVGGAG